MRSAGRAARAALGILGLLALLPAAQAATPGAHAGAGGVEIMPFDEVQVGMKGVGRTVFEGTRVEEFTVEIIARMRNILPKRDLLLAKLDGGPLRDTGILEGMSGSPVYIDGRLVGAVAYSWGFAKEPICGITPIEEMLGVLERDMELPEGSSAALGPSPGRRGEPAPVSLLAWPDRMVSFLRSRPARVVPLPEPLSGTLRPMRPTLAFSGFQPDVARAWFPLFEAMSMRPVIAGMPAAAAGAQGSEAPFTAGSAFGVTLVRGDLDVTAIGTVTYAEGDAVLGFGHPMLGMGAAAMPMTSAYVYGSFPSLESSFKLAAPVQEVGAIVQDRFPGVAGMKGAHVKMVPVHVEMRRGDGETRSFRFDIVPDPLLTPGLLHVSLLSLLSSQEKNVGDITLRIREGSRIQVGDDLDVKLDNLFSGDQSVLYTSGTVAYMTYLLLNNEERPAQIRGINLLLDYEDSRRTARIDRIWLERYTAAPGETLPLHVSLVPYRSEPVTVDIPLKIPKEAPEGKVLLQVGDSLTLSRMEAVGGTPYLLPRGLEHLVWLLNHIRANQKVYATVIMPDNGAFIAGERLPNLPPSVASVLLQPSAGQIGPARVPFRALLEASAETSSAVRGYQRAILEIRR